MPLLIFIFLFFYIYLLAFKGVPFGMRLPIYSVGFIFVLINAIKSYSLTGKINIIEKKLYLFIILAAITLLSLTSILINQTNELVFIRFSFSVILYYLASYAIIYLCFKIDSDFSIDKLFRLIIYVITFQSVLAFLMFIFPAFGNFMISIQKTNDVVLGIVNEAKSIRIIGFGSTFFEAGIVNGLGLILIAFLIKYKKSEKIFLLTLMYIIISIIGLLMARTTIIGVVLSLLILFKPEKKLKLKKTILKFSAYTVLVVFLSIFSILILNPKIANKFKKTSTWAFELFINYHEHGTFESNSTNQLKKMFVFPNNIKTYLIGDGYFEDPLHPNNYYKATDVGYLRLIYYFGFGGLILFFYLQYELINRTIQNLKTFGNIKFLYIILIYIFILNFKGLVDLMLFLLLFYHYSFFKIKYDNKLLRL